MNSRNRRIFTQVLIWVPLLIAAAMIFRLALTTDGSVVQIVIAGILGVMWALAVAAVVLIYRDRRRVSAQRTVDAPEPHHGDSAA